MNTKFWLAATLCLLGCQQGMSQKYTISGYVSDIKTGERLRGASIYFTGKSVGTTTNDFGFYSITLPADSVSFTVSYSGFASFSRQLLLNSDMAIDVPLEPAKMMDEVVVITRRASIQQRTQMSTIDLPIETIKSLPKFLGETDIIKAIQLLPGVQAGNEGQSGIYVRGGGPDQNLILLDGVPVYNVSHLFGFFSVFNSDAVKSVELVKGGFPARYGGRLSSVLDIQMKEGSKTGFHGEGGIGLIASRLTLEGPFKKGKESSFIVSGRRTYIDLLAQPLIKAQTDGISTGYYFYDLNAKANVKLGEKDHVYFSGYFGNDRFYAKEKSADVTFNAGLTWGNATAVARWNHLFNKKLFGNLTAHYSRYNFDIRNEEQSTTRPNEYYTLKYFSGIEDVNAHYDVDFLPNPNHFIKAGTGITFHYYKPSAIQAKESSPGSTPVDTLIRSQFLHAQETDTYVEDDIRLSSRLKSNIGLHFTTFSVRGQTFTSLQPRVAMRYLLNPNFGIKASYAQMNQYIHLLTNNGIGLPTDLWVPVTNKVPPQKSHQVSAGIAYNYKTNYEVSVEGYYKKMNNVIEYAEGASYLDASGNWEDKVEIGKAQSYGAEFLVQRKKGKTTGLIGYTLSWTDRQFANLNFGNTFPYRYDRRHDFKTAVVQKVNKKMELSATWVFGTGQAVTLPVEKYVDDRGNEIQVYEKRNGYRMAPYHRLDFSATFSKVKKRHTRSWIFSIYNVYNRRNPFYIYLGTKNTVPHDKVFKQVSLFPILPSVSYQFKF